MAGNHTLQLELELCGVSDILFRGEGAEPNAAIVVYLANGITLYNTNYVHKVYPSYYPGSQDV